MDVKNGQKQVEYNSVLVVLVPEAEPLVGPFRSKYDPSAADGMPAHVTVNYPFLPAGYDESGAIDSLNHLFSRYQSFIFSLQAIGRFPGVLYLEPIPDQPFKDLISAVAKRFPESAPYGGMFAEVVPHLTVAHVEDSEKIERISQQLAIAAIGKLPIKSAVDKVWLMDNRHGRWIRRVSFTLEKHTQDFNVR
jgi:2'-5' RNA ligase